jgi:hypothetical protein
MAYKELIQTGGIECTAVGEKVCLDIKGNLAGDILLFIAPVNKAALAGKDLYELLRSDGELEQLRNVVFKSLKLKYAGLSLLPESLVWITNIILSVLYGYINSSKIVSLFIGEIDLAGMLNIIPLLIIAAITPFLGKTFGLKMMKPLLTMIIWIIKIFRKVRNRIAL